MFDIGAESAEEEVAINVEFTSVVFVVTIFVVVSPGSWLLFWHKFCCWFPRCRCCFCFSSRSSLSEAHAWNTAGPGVDNSVREQEMGSRNGIAVVPVEEVAFGEEEEEGSLLPAALGIFLCRSCC